MPAADKVKETAIDEVQRVRHLTEEAVRSGAYFYPVRGLYYFLTHKPLWQPLLSRLMPSLTLGVGITTLMFFFTYLPQLGAMVFTSGPLSPLTTALLVLSESSTLFNALSKTFLVEDALIDTFDGTLVARNMTGIVSEGRNMKAGGDPIAKLGKRTSMATLRPHFKLTLPAVIKKPFAKFSPTAIIRYFLYLPLNFIPVVGTMLFIVMQGRANGPAAHARYFQLKKWSKTQRDEWVETHKAAYTSFGIPATLLELVPIAGVLFTFTNQVGAALWAADLEQSGSTSPGLQSQAQKVSK